MFPPVARSSAPLLAVFVLGGVVDAAQANSGSMLYGLAKHRVFTRLALAESLVSLSAVAYFTSAGDLWKAAVASTAVLTVNRGLLTPMLLCRHLYNNPQQTLLLNLALF